MKRIMFSYWEVSQFYSKDRIDLIPASNFIAPVSPQLTNPLTQSSFVLDSVRSKDHSLIIRRFELVMPNEFTC